MWRRHFRVLSRRRGRLEVVKTFPDQVGQCRRHAPFHPLGRGWVGVEDVGTWDRVALAPDPHLTLALSAQAERGRWGEVRFNISGNCCGFTLVLVATLALFPMGINVVPNRSRVSRPSQPTSSPR
jgi:hypothetical protein